MNVPETRYAKASGGVSVAYQVVGDGPVDLLWLDGAFGNLEVMWEQPRVSGFFTTLASRCRVIRFDMRGTGLSDRGDFAPNMETQMQDALSVLDVVGSQRTAIVGHMWGGAAAALLATTYPKRTTALVLASTQARNRWAPDYPWGFSEEDLTRSLDMIESGWGTESYAAWHLSMSALSMLGDRDFVRWWAKVQRHWVGPRSAAALDRQFWDSDVTDVLRSVQVPTLILAREWDDTEEDEYVAGLIPNSRIERVSGTDWMVWVGDHDDVVSSIHSFLEAKPRPHLETDRALATVLFTDIVGSTAKASELGDAGWRALIERHHATVRTLLDRHRGSEVDTAGDGFFATFDGPARAVRCAEAVVEAVLPLGIEVRAGVHTGECETIDGKVGGVAVNIGARVGALAGASQVLVSSTVKDLTAGSDLTFEDAGEHVLKGVPDRWRLYRVVA